MTEPQPTPQTEPRQHRHYTPCLANRNRTLRTPLIHPSIPKIRLGMCIYAPDQSQRTQTPKHYRSRSTACTLLPPKIPKNQSRHRSGVLKSGGLGLAGLATPSPSAPSSRSWSMTLEKGIGIVEVGESFLLVAACA
jgi:hypothetical protein